MREESKIINLTVRLGKGRKKKINKRKGRKINGENSLRRSFKRTKECLTNEEEVIKKNGMKV